MTRFGMAKAVADVNGEHRQGGFSLTEAGVTGFSHMHDSGTGGGMKLLLNLLSSRVDTCQVPHLATFLYSRRQDVQGTISIVANSTRRIALSTTQKARSKRVLDISRSA